MQLIILGNTNDDKGTQLEKLAMALLTKLGYKEPELSHIGSGGLEIDVVAYYEMPTLSGITKHRVLIECKAHSNPINTTDWLKFIGKITVEEVKRGANIHGCFLALNGANGNARGIYEDIRERKQNIQLLSGQDLRRTLFDEYKICSQEYISNTISRLTSRKPLSYSICFYDGIFTWAVQFEDDHFAAFNSEGDVPLNGDSLAVKLIASNTSFGAPLDLLKEQQAIIRHKEVVSLTISQLFINRGIICINEITQQNAGESLTIDKESITDIELSQAIQELSKENLITVNEQIVSLPSPPTITVYQKLLKGTIYISTIQSEFYSTGINKTLLGEICQLQGGLKLSESNEEVALFLLKRSPSALAFSMRPNPMLTNSLTQFTERPPSVDLHAEQYFLQSLNDGFTNDFKQPSLSDYFHNTCGIVEIEKNSTVKIKSKSEVAIELSLKDRYRIAQADESIGGGLIHISLINDAPEPWEPRLESGQTDNSALTS